MRIAASLNGSSCATPFFERSFATVHVFCFKVDFAPSPRCDFVQPRAGQEQQLRHRPEWIVDLTKRVPHEADFIVRQHAIAACLRRGGVSLSQGFLSTSPREMHQLNIRRRTADN